MRHYDASHLTESNVKSGCPDCEQGLCPFAQMIGNFKLRLTLSNVAFFVSSYFITRTLDGAGFATGMTRGVLIFSIALMLSYRVAWAADFLTK